MKPAPLGERELEVLRYVADHAPVSVRQVAEQFGQPRGLAHTTILTVMERLRHKGYLGRRKAPGAYLYSPVLPRAELARTLVRDFVEKALGGSVGPLVNYLAEAQNLSPQELADLRQIVEQMDVDTGEKP
ncbi:MAG TPA: BlaI/MecI/CopY family transcriptional regulator [Chthonomonadaceae bacterium]|nr:BlaI/MecI/CopY family transcriptional regulator [Chthonomonadaceae bacterium]